MADGREGEDEKSGVFAPATPPGEEEEAYALYDDDALHYLLSPSAPQSHLVMGNVRTGASAIPTQIQEELFSLGFNVRNQEIVNRDEKWTREYMPAFRSYNESNGHLNISSTHPVIGMLVSNIRSGDTAIPPQFEEELFALGLDVRNQRIVQRDERWTRKYMPAFRAYYEKNKSANAPQSHPVLGKLVANIRTGYTVIPPQFEEELFALGLDVRNQRIVQRDEMWTRKYMPAFRAYYEKNKSANAPPSHPVLGRLVNAIRTGQKAIPPQFEESLHEMGLFLCTASVAKHVAMRLERRVGKGSSRVRRPTREC